MSKTLFVLLLACLFACNNEKVPTTIKELDASDFGNVILNVILRKDAEKKIKASSFFTINGAPLKAEEAKVFINGTEIPLDSSRWTEVIKEDGYIVDIKTPDGVNDTEMNPDDLRGIILPDTLVLKRSDNGIGINNLSTAITVTLTSNNQPVKIVSVNDGILVIDPATLGQPGSNGMHMLNILFSTERKSELSNKMRSVTRQMLEKKNVSLKTE